MAGWGAIALAAQLAVAAPDGPRVAASALWPGLWGVEAGVPLGATWRVEGRFAESVVLGGWSGLVAGLWPVGDGQAGFVVGGFQLRDQLGVPFSGAARPAYVLREPGALIGARLRWARGPWWVVASPHVMVPLTVDPFPSFVEALTVGPPWLEVGYRFPIGAEAALRASWLPIALGWRF